MAELSFREIAPDDATLILGWRTSPRVTRFMNTDIDHDPDAQRAWIEACYDRPDYYHWLICADGEPAGFISLSAYDPAAGTASWGFYIGRESALGRGIGRDAPPPFYDFCFSRLGVNRIDTEVFADNAAALDLYRRYGFVRRPENDRAIAKGGQTFQLLALELEKARFQAQSAFAGARADFPVTRWRARPSFLDA